MNTNQNETKTQDAPQLNPRTGFYTNVMPVLSKSGEYVHFFLPGDVTVTEYANRFKGLLGFDYVPKAPNAEKREFTPRTGLHAKVRVGLSYINRPFLVSNLNTGKKSLG